MNSTSLVSPPSLPKKARRILEEEGWLALLRRGSFKLRTRLQLRLPWQAVAPEPSDDAADTGLVLPRQNGQVSTDVIVCVHNALEDVRACLAALEQTSGSGFRLILVDDGSDEPTETFLAGFARQRGLRLIRNASARGYTFAANQGLQASSAQQVVLLNSDTVITPGWLEAMTAVAWSDPRIGLVGPLSNTASWQSIPKVECDGDWHVNALPDGMQAKDLAEAMARMTPFQPADVGFLNGFCLLIKRNTLEDVGGFDEEAFGKGYGEENDFCLRAHRRGWRLAICLRAYVFHSQSKSYSNERRRALSAHADRQLTLKHGDGLKQQQLQRTMAHPLLLYSRAAARRAEAVHHAHQSIAERHSGRRVLFLLPAEHAGGGANVVISEATAMREAGVDAWIANLPANRFNFEQAYPRLDLPCCYVEASDPEALRFEVGDFDALVATHNLSAHWAAQTESIRLGYYIQDYEPFFYPTGSKGQEKARHSYTLSAPYRHFCKTRWTAELLQQRHQLNATVIGPSVDSRAFAPGRWASGPGPLLVAAMIRVSCERRQPQRTANVLNRLAQLYGGEVQFRCFGSTNAELATAGIQLCQQVQNLGRLSPSGVAQLLRQAHVFIDASTFQAMGLTAMEAMASGTCVIGPQAGGFVEVISGDDTQDADLGIAVDTNSTEAILESACQLIDNQEHRQALSEAAFGVTAYQPVISAAALLDCLFEDG